MQSEVEGSRVECLVVRVAMIARFYPMNIKQGPGGRV